MISNILDRVSFWSLFLVVVLLPLFFIPFTNIPIETSKGLLVIFGLAVSVISWSLGRFFDGKIVIPKLKMLFVLLGIVFSFLLSAIFSKTFKVSMFGTMFDMGTFWFMLVSFLLLFMSSIVLREFKKAKILLFGLLFSGLILTSIQTLHLFFPGIISIFNLDTTANLVGSLNVLAVYSSLIVLFSVFVIEFFSISRLFKIILSVILLLSLFLIAVVNFSLVWLMLGIFTLFIFVYKVSFFINKQEGEKKTGFPLSSFIVAMLSLIFFISSQFIGGILPSIFKVSSNEVRPSFISTMSVFRGTITNDPVFGIGPNKFTDAWNLYKPTNINQTVFWDSSFSNGSGTIPSFFVTTGILGTLLWLLFFVLLIMCGYKSLSKFNKEGEIDIKTFIFYLVSLYLFMMSIFYTIGVVLFFLAFAFLGVFMGFSINNNKDKEISFSFLDDVRKSFFAILFFIIIMIISITLVFKYTERLVSVVYFQKAINANTTEQAEVNIKNAIYLSQNDLYLRTYTQIYILKINSLVSKTQEGGSLSDEEKTNLQTYFDQAIKSAQMATSLNRTNYLNFETLGSVYEVGLSLGAAESFDKALESYKKAESLSPLSPSIKLNISRLLYLNKKVDEANEYAQKSLVLKDNYVDALLILSQIAKQKGDDKSSILYIEKALYYYPENEDLRKYLNTLKNYPTQSKITEIPEVSNVNNN